jgi:hypothetical protein
VARLLARPDGIFVSDFEQGEIGPDLFRQGCKFGLEGLVSKRRDSTHRAGRFAKLDQGEKPKSSDIGTGPGVVFMNKPRSRLTKESKNFLCRINMVFRKKDASWPQRCDTAIN